MADLRLAENLSRLGTETAFEVLARAAALAAELGTTREGVSRALRSLRASGVISQRGAQVKILDPIRLERLAGETPSRGLRQISAGHAA